MSPLAALITDWVITALWPIVGKSGMALYSGVLFVTAGLVVGLLVLAPWLLSRGRWRRLIDPALAPTLFMMGLLCTVATAIYISALAYTTPANAAIMAQAEVLYSALLCAVFLKEHLPWTQFVASLLVITGTGLIMAQDISSPRWKGDLMVLATPWMFQVSHIFARRLPKSMDAYTISGGRIFYGVLSMIPFCAWSLSHSGRWTSSPEGLRLILLQGIGMSSANFVLWYIAILGMDLAKATAILLSYPALTVIFSWVLGKETISWIQMAGLVITLSGAYWISHLVLQAQKAPGPKLPPEAAEDI